MIIKRITLILILLLAPFAIARAADGKALLKQFLQGLTTLEADFQQTLEQPDGGGVIFSSGTFYLKRPGKLRWEYDPPNDQLIVADGKRIWLYDKELEQVSHRSQKAALEGTPAQLLSSTGPLEQHFEIKDLGVQAGLNWLELLPRDKDSQFHSLRLGLDDKQLLRMEMADNFGQTTRFEFSHMQRNPQLDDELFDFTPPSTVDLIGDL
ncbi:MAG: outer membrane lipoprotein chaperone LolA [Chromatiales bacterium]|jgi:outer membrane lipoprotein carrier protein